MGTRSERVETCAPSAASPTVGARPTAIARTVSSYVRLSCERIVARVSRASRDGHVPQTPRRRHRRHLYSGR